MDSVFVVERKVEVNGNLDPIVRNYVTIVQTTLTRQVACVVDGQTRNRVRVCVVVDVVVEIVRPHDTCKWLGHNHWYKKEKVTS